MGPRFMHHRPGGNKPSIPERPDGSRKPGRRHVPFDGAKARAGSARKNNDFLTKRPGPHLYSPRFSSARRCERAPDARASHHAA